MHFVWLLGARGELLTANDAALNLIGMSASQVEGKPFWDAPWWRNQQESRSALQTAFDRVRIGHDFNAEVQMRLPGSNGKAPVHLRFTGVRTSSGELIHTIVEASDGAAAISDDPPGASTANAFAATALDSEAGVLRQLNTQLEHRLLRESLERQLLTDILEGTNAFVQAIDFNYRWLVLNQASIIEFRRIFGKHARVGESTLDILEDRPSHRAAVKAIWDRALAGEEFTAIEEVGDPTLDRRIYEMKFRALRDREGQQIGAYRFAYDVTERLHSETRLAEAQAALRQAQKLDAMGQLTGGVAHDFNNLLTPIIGSLDLLQRKKVGGEREQRFVSNALQSAERAKTLVHRLLAFARRQPLQIHPVDVRAVIEGMLGLITSATGPQIKVSLHVEEGLPWALADAHQLEMAILNLCVNARDAMEQGGTLEIGLAREDLASDQPDALKAGTYVRISVQDSGKGMDDKTLSRAIEPFFSTKGVGKGTGLGLSMVHGLALQLGGKLALSSKPDRGTNVQLWMPASIVTGSQAEVLDTTLTGPHGGSVLLVDDEALVRESTSDMLVELGFRVIQADSAEVALERLAAGLQVETVVTDHLMPGMTGVELARIIRTRWPHLRVIIISGYADIDGVAPDLERLSKPFRQSEIARLLSTPAGKHG